MTTSMRSLARLAQPRLLLLLLLAFVLAGCGAGPYGHSPRYVPLDDEEKAVAGAREYDPVMAERQPEEWRAGKTMLFGVVQSRQAGPNGQALLKLGVRRIEDRNLCANGDDADSCRVTVSDKDFGIVWALVALHGEDNVGPTSVGLRSLLRVVGRIGQDVAPADGAPILRASYYRHWPAGYWVTRGGSGAYMKQ
ncbi:MAG TPA: hypothetical protein VHV30_09370 [Polyangiaceae bacterium]|nr:hypothetical protein [Polyangiaceae bacterium]